MCLDLLQKFNFLVSTITHKLLSDSLTSLTSLHLLFFLHTAHSAPVTAVAFAPVPGITVDEGLRDIGEVVIAGDYQGRIKVYVNSDVL